VSDKSDSTKLTGTAVPNGDGSIGDIMIPDYEWEFESVPNVVPNGHVHDFDIDKWRAGAIVVRGGYASECVYLTNGIQELHRGGYTIDVAKKIAMLVVQNFGQDLGGHWSHHELHEFVDTEWKNASKMIWSQETLDALDEFAAVLDKYAAQADELERQKRLRSRRIDRDVKRELDAEDRGEVVIPEPKTLKELLAEPDDPVRWRVMSCLPTGSRAIVAAARKTGKTTLVANVAGSLADGGLLLGSLPVADVPGTVVVIDNEMSEGMLRQWYRDMDIGNADRIVVWTLRGQGRAFDVLDPIVRADWAAKLRALPGGTSTLILDCLTPALGALGLTESNEDVNPFLIGFDALLVEGGVKDALIAHHMGHVEERSRGASRLRDWPEVEWRYVRERDEDDREIDNGARFLSAYGRDVDLPESRLEYDPATRRLSMIGGTRSAHRLDQYVPAVVAIVAEEPGIQTGPLKEKLKEATGVSRATTLTNIIKRAGRDAIRIEGGVSGKPNHHFVTT
jgi:hypothetical protein